MNFIDMSTGSARNAAAVGLIAALPHWRITGMAAANSEVLAELQRLGTTYYLADISGIEGSESVGTFSFRKFMQVLLLIPKILITTLRSSVIYINISATPWGVAKNCLMILPAVLLRRRVVGHYHGGGFRKFYLTSGPLCQLSTRLLLSHFHRIVVLDRCFVHQFRLIGSENRQRVTVVENGVEGPSRELFSTLRWRRSESTFRILFLSNLMEEKGYMELIAGFRRFKEKGYSAQLDLCGEFFPSKPARRGFGSLSDLRRHLAAEELASSVFFHGSVKGSAKERMLSDAHILALPTRHPAEGVPLCILEAFAWGLPVLASNLQVLRLLETESCGVLIDPANPDSIATGLVRLYTSDREQLSWNARELWESRFRSARFRQEIASLLLAEGSND